MEKSIVMCPFLRVFMIIFYCLGMITKASHRQYQKGVDTSAAFGRCYLLLFDIFFSLITSDLVDVAFKVSVLK